MLYKLLIGYSRALTESFARHIMVSIPRDKRISGIITYFLECNTTPITFPADEHHGPLTGTKLYSLVTEAHT